MDHGHQLIKDQLFFRKELMERFHWFISLRWIAVALGLSASWGAYVMGYRIPIEPISATFVFCALYNLVFVAWKRLKPPGRVDAVHASLFAHIQFTLDFIILFIIIYLTGGFYSPVVIFIFFPILLTGILLPPVSCYIYSIIALIAIGFMAALQIFQIFPPYLPLLHYPVMSDDMLLRNILAAYAIFGTAVLVTAYLITSLKISLRIKGRELLTVSKALEISIARLRALYEMVKEMHVCADLKALADSATKNAAVIMGVKACSIKLLDDQRQSLKFISAYGLSEDYTKKGPIDIEKSPVNLQVIRGDRFSIGSVDEKELFQYPEDILKENIASMICLPLRVEKMIIGVFCVYSGKPDFFSSDDTDFFSLMADLTAIGIENIKNEEDKTWFLQKAAHQLRAPLNATFSILDMMDKGYLGPTSPQQEESLRRAKTRIRLLGDMVGDLLKIGIKRAVARRPVVSRVNVKKKLVEVSDIYAARAFEKNIRFNLEIGEKIPVMQADPQIFDNLFSNLISNAIKYTPADGEVSVILSMEEENNITFTVSDTGIGILETEISNIFNDFYRSETAKSHTEEGTGLGLVIVKESLDVLKGTVTVESIPGKETRFICRIPVSA